MVCDLEALFWRDLLGIAELLFIMRERMLLLACMKRKLSLSMSLLLLDGLLLSEFIFSD